MKKFILNELENLEKSKNIKILYACESGSRAWGFSSTESDYDIRFIYVNRINFYLSIERKDEQIEIKKDNFDFVGWDLKKALYLLRKSNPSILEWIYSPEIYIKDDFFFKELKSLEKISFNPITLMHHYLGMAKQNLKYIYGNRKESKIYLYILKSLFALQWLEKYNLVPPIEFKKLYDFADLNPEIKRIINLIVKSKIKNKKIVKEFETLDGYITSKISYYEEILKNYESKITLPNVKIFNEVFQKILLRFDKDFCLKLKKEVE